MQAGINRLFLAHFSPSLSPGFYILFLVVLLSRALSSSVSSQLWDYSKGEGVKLGNIFPLGCTGALRSRGWMICALVEPNWFVLEHCSVWGFLGFFGEVFLRSHRATTPIYPMKSLPPLTHAWFENEIPDLAGLDTRLWMQFSVLLVF